MRIVEPSPYLASLDERRRFLLFNPELFLAHYFSVPSGEEIEQFHLRLIKTATTQERALILYPAFHGKTTSLWRLMIRDVCLDPDVRIGYIAKNDREAQQIGAGVLAELMENERLIRDFGPFKPEDNDAKPWAITRMSVDKRTIRAKEPTMALFGSGAKTTLGHRTDKTYCDDVVTNENSNTPEAREKVRQWFNQNVQTMGRFPDSPLIVVGTRFHPQDLYGDLEEMTDPETGTSIWPAQREDAIVDDETRQTLWPKRWPWHALQKLKAQMGTLDFNKRLRNIAVDPSRMQFKEAYVKGGFIGRERYPGCLDPDYTVGDLDESWMRFGGFDPAIGRGRSSKFCASVVLALGSCAKHERCYWVVDLIRDQMTLPQSVEIIISQHERYDCISTMIEANGYQAGLEQAVQARVEELGRAIRTEPHTTGRNKTDPEVGIMRLPPYFENGQFHIPHGNQESRRKMSTLVEELVEYPGRTTDTVLALWFAWYASEQMAPPLRSYNRLEKRAPGLLRTFGGRRQRLNPYYHRPDERVPVGLDPGREVD